MLIKVNVNSYSHEINVEPNDTISTVKTKVEEVICVPPQMQRLIHNGAPLSDEATVESSNMKGGDVLHMVVMLKAGGAL